VRKDIVIMVWVMFLIARQGLVKNPADFGPITTNRLKRVMEWRKIQYRIEKPVLVPITDENKDGITNWLDLSWFCRYWLQPMEPEDWLKGNKER
jgi:hypothetical protein